MKWKLGNINYNITFPFYLIDFHAVLHMMYWFQEVCWRSWIFLVNIKYDPHWICFTICKLNRYKSNVTEWYIPIFSFPFNKCYVILQFPITTRDGALTYTADTIAISLFLLLYEGREGEAELEYGSNSKHKMYLDIFFINPNSQASCQFSNWFGCQPRSPGIPHDEPLKLMKIPDTCTFLANRSIWEELVLKGESLLAVKLFGWNETKLKTLIQ